jgi:hypothetical protein
MPLHGIIPTHSNLITINNASTIALHHPLFFSTSNCISLFILISSHPTSPHLTTSHLHIFNRQILAPPPFTCSTLAFYSLYHRFTLTPSPLHCPNKLSHDFISFFLFSFIFSFNFVLLCFSSSFAFLISIRRHQSYRTAFTSFTSRHLPSACLTHSLTHSPSHLLVHFPSTVTIKSIHFFTSLSHLTSLAFHSSHIQFLSFFSSPFFIFPSTNISCFPPDRFCTACVCVLRVPHHHITSRLLSFPLFILIIITITPLCTHLPSSSISTPPSLLLLLLLPPHSQPQPRILYYSMFLFFLFFPPYFFFFPFSPRFLPFSLSLLLVFQPSQP